ncbi:tetratricopeptide repeat protein [Chloroflexi bacterium TSY]|nr:tetratricopeptide repeat protein [Chloroflexi bacterium TSY]
MDPIDKEQALHILDFALNHEDAWTVILELLLALAPKMERLGHRRDWLGYLERGIKRCHLMQDWQCEGKLQLHIGVLQRLLGDLDQARRSFRRSVACYEQTDDKVGQARAWNELAVVSHRQRNLDQVKTFVDRSLTLLESQHPERARCYTILGEWAFEQKQWQQALDYYQKSLTLREDQGHAHQIAWALNDIGRVFHHQGQYHTALTYYERALALINRTQEPVQWSLMQMNRGAVYLVQGQAEDALRLFEDMVSTLQNSQDNYHLSMVYHNQAMAHQALQQWPLAVESYQYSVQLAQRSGDIASVVNALDGLGTTYMSMVQPELAIETFQHALEQLDELTTEPHRNQLYETVSGHLQRAQAPRSMDP